LPRRAPPRNLPPRLSLLQSLKFKGRDLAISRDITPEIIQRLEFLDHVGLGYLQLDRSAVTLSGGESQRIRLAAQLGSNLQGVLYILDEPTIGLHPRDNSALLGTLQELKNKGNSLLLVEHDDDTIRAATHLIDLGPGAGVEGGEVVFEGKPTKKSGSKNSPTIQALQNPLAHPSRGERRKILKAKKNWLQLKGCTANNLKNIDVEIPLGRLTVLTGVSGSGKSSLMRGCISVAGTSGLQAQPSFNNKDGQCPECKGNGRIKLEMDFLPTTWIDCEACLGDRYNPATLEIRYNGLTIGDILRLNIKAAAEFFSAHPRNPTHERPPKNHGCRPEQHQSLPHRGAHHRPSPTGRSPA